MDPTVLELVDILQRGLELLQLPVLVVHIESLQVAPLGGGVLQDEVECCPIEVGNIEHALFLHVEGVSHADDLNLIRQGDKHLVDAACSWEARFQKPVPEAGVLGLVLGDVCFTALGTWPMLIREDEHHVGSPQGPRTTDDDARESSMPIFPVDECPDSQRPDSQAERVEQVLALDDEADATADHHEVEYIVQPLLEGPWTVRQETGFECVDESEHGRDRGVVGLHDDGLVQVERREVVSIHDRLDVQDAVAHLDRCPGPDEHQDGDGIGQLRLQELQGEQVRPPVDGQLVDDAHEERRQGQDAGD